MKGGCTVVCEGANMPSTPEAIEVYLSNGILYGPAKASNAGGVATSGLEMSQNSERLSWSFEEVDAKLKGIMEGIFHASYDASVAAGSEGNLMVGANCAGFLKVATAMMAQGITMGDEFHQRNIASSALLMRTLAPQIARLEHDKQQIAEVMDFLSVTDQFFLNLAMAYCKAAMDAGAQVRSGSIVTAMTRNGDMFGIRVSGLGDRWFTAPVNTPQGLFFTGFSQEQANPDMGDSAHH